MKEMIFWGLYLSSAGVIIYKILKTLNYFNAKFKERNVDALYKQLSVIQIIEDFEEVTEFVIKNNIKTLKGSCFIFILEKDKNVYMKKLEEVLGKEENLSFEILKVDNNINIKEKLKIALELSKEYTLILNGNIEIQGNINEMLEELVLNEFIVNGLTYENEAAGFFEGLKGAFYNWHSLFAYLSLAEIGKEERVNFDFFAGRTKTLVDSKIFDDFKEYEVDEVEMAKLISGKGINIFQSRVVGKNRNKTKDRLDFYDSIGKEVEVILNLLKDTTDIKVYFLTIFPIILPGLTFLCSLLMGKTYMFLVVGSLLIKSIDTYVIRKSMVEKTVGLGEIFREIFVDIFGVIFIFFRKSR